jgi:hypothetical protein
MAWMGFDVFFFFFVTTQKCELSAKEGKFKLRDLLTVPMQRVLKYHLLLDQLIKNTTPVRIVT